MPVLFTPYLRIIERIAGRQPRVALTAPATLNLLLWLPAWTAAALLA